VYRYAVPDVLDETFDIEHHDDAEAAQYALRIAEELLNDNEDFRGQSLKVMKEGRLIAHLTIGRLH
jgi:hypothetical protein